MLVAPVAYPWHEAAARVGIHVVVPRAPGTPAAASAQAKLSDRWLPALARWYRSRAPAQVKWLLGSWQECRAMRRLFDAVPAAVIHVQSAGGEVTALAASRRRPRVPVVSTLHFPPSMVRPDIRRSLSWRLVCALNMRAFDLGIAVSRATLEQWEKLSGGKLQPPRGAVIHNGSAESVEVPNRVTARAELGLHPDAVVLLNVAALVTYKDQASLLEAARILRDGGDEVELVIVGEGPRRAELEALAGERQLSRHVRFLGHRADKTTLFAAADVYVQSSRDEAFPMVLLEAGLQELPIVATEVGGVAELITDGVTGSLVPSEDPAALAGAIRTLLREPDQGRGRARQLAERIRGGFLAEHMVRDTAAAYRRLLELRSEDQGATIPTI